MDSSNSQPWYRDGLRFTCSQCGDCCTGAPGYVWVNQAEVEAMATVMGMEVDAFRGEYTRKIGIRYSLKELAGGDCVFFDSQTRRCTVYSVRPRQCRTWPFWESNLRTPEAWAETCRVCPGSGQGELHQIEEIEAKKDVMRI